MKFDKNIDVLVGAQYGDEGKGMVAKLLADASSTDGADYAWTGRVGGQNAEHRFIHQGCDFCARIMPSAGAFRPNIKVVLGAGHCFRPEQFITEATHLGIPLIPGEVLVDPHAMWLREDHAVANLELGNRRGTTGWGVGVAMAEKVRRRPDTKLIGDSPLMKPYLCDVPMELNRIDGSGLIEGSQGTMLSLDHGHYPFSTAKNVTAPAICAEMGVSQRRVRAVFGIVRLVFMRVSGPSGPTGGSEVSFDDVEGRTNLRLPHHKRLQGDSTRWAASKDRTKAEEERLFDLSFVELFKAHTLSGFDSIAVTFVDYHRKGNYRVTEWEELHKDTRNVVERISREIAPVFLVRTGQGEHDNIWLRDPWEF